MESKEGTLQKFLQEKNYKIADFKNLSYLGSDLWEAQIIFEFLKKCSLAQETKKSILNMTRRNQTINVGKAVNLIEEAEQGRIQGSVRVYPATTNQQPKELDYFTDEFRSKHINRGSKSKVKEENVGIFKTRNVSQNTLITENGKKRLTQELKKRQEEYKLVYAFLEKEAKAQNTFIESVVFTSTLPINVTSINKEEIQKRQILNSRSDETYETFIRYSVQPFKVQKNDNKNKKGEIICYFVNHFDGEVETSAENNKPGFALLSPPQENVQGINIKPGTWFRFANYDRNVVHPPVNFNSDLVQPLSIFPIQPVEFNYSFSNEPILLNGMKVLFDNPTPTTSVTLQPKQRGTNNGR